MKQMLWINGTMGVGKTTVCNLLRKQLPNSVFLDGDWCWMMSPFAVTEETKAMVLDNIAHLLNNFLACTQFDTILFCWVMDRQDILDNLRNRLSLRGCRLKIFTLTAEPEALTARVEADIAAGIRSPGDVARSLERCSHFAPLPTEKIDTTHRTPQQIVQRILESLETEKGRD